MSRRPRRALATALGLTAALIVAASPPGAAASSRAAGPSAAPSTIHVPDDAPSIQAAVDRASPGTLVLVAPGVYRQTVLVTHPDVVIRGLDRNRTILDGGFRLRDGIAVVADGVAVENLTARDYLGNGFVWRGVDGYRGSYLTASRMGQYGLFASRSQHGQLDHSYASGAVEAGVYVGACNPCHALVTDDVAEHNAVGFLATNASGDVLVARSRWRRNRIGIAATSSDLEPMPPQDGLVIAGNEVTGGRPADAPRRRRRRLHGRRRGRFLVPHQQRHPPLGGGEPHRHRLGDDRLRPGHRLLPARRRASLHGLTRPEPARLGRRADLGAAATLDHP